MTDDQQNSTGIREVDYTSPFSFFFFSCRLLVVIITLLCGRKPIASNPTTISRLSREQPLYITKRIEGGLFNRVEQNLASCQVDRGGSMSVVNCPAGRCPYNSSK